MLETLREKSVHAYSFTPKELKQVSFILRGLCQGVEAEYVKNALDEVLPEVISKVSKFKTSRSIKNNLDTGLFLVTLNPGKSLSDISHIKYLHKQSLTWERPKKKNNEIQCRRCQGLGHISKNCGSQYNCVKCDQKHAPGECQRSKSDSSDPYCINCRSNGHPANWRGCPVFKKYAAKRRERIQNAINIEMAATENLSHVISNNYVTADKTFASHFHPTTSHSSKPSIIDEFLKLSTIFLQPEELTLEQEINIFLAEFNNMSKSKAKDEFMRLLKKVKDTYGP